MKKIKITESDLYNIIKQVLLEQEEDVWYTDKEDFNFRLFKGFDGNSEKFAKSHNKFYDKIVVDGDLDLSNSSITSLPNNLEVKGTLDLENCENLKYLPNNLKIGLDLNLNNCENLTYLPDNLSVGAILHLDNTQINSIPDNLVKKLSWGDMKRLVKEGVIDEPEMDYNIELFIPVEELDNYIDNRQYRETTDLYRSILTNTFTYEAETDYSIDDLTNYISGENAQKIEDILRLVAEKENFDMDEFDYMELTDMIENFDKDSNISNAIYNSASIAEEASYIEKYKETLFDCLRELGTIEEISNEGVKLSIDMEEYLWPERYPRRKFKFDSDSISEDMNECEHDLICVFKTLIGHHRYRGYSRIDNPVFYIDGDWYPDVDGKVFSQNLKEELSQISS